MNDPASIRVLFLSDHYCYHGGVVHGATTYFRHVLPRLARQPNVKLTCCFLREYQPLAQQLQQSGVNPIFLERSKWDLRALGDLIRLIRVNRINLLHAAGVKGMLLARIAGRLTGARCIVHLHDADVPAQPMRAVQRAVSRWTDAAIGVSQHTCHAATRTFALDPSKVHCVQNGIDLSQCLSAEPVNAHALHDELNIPREAPVVAMVGRFVPVKNHTSMIQAMPALRRKVPGAVLVLIGDGPERARCEQLVDALGLGEMIRFTGHRSDVSRILPAVDVLAMPSFSEGLPFAGIEALASGVPIVAFREGGLPELAVHEYSGLLVTPGDMNGFVDTLSRTLLNPSLRRRLSEGARAHAERFHVDHHVARMLALYRAVLDPTVAQRHGEPDRRGDVVADPGPHRATSPAAAQHTPSRT